MERDITARGRGVINRLRHVVARFDAVIVNNIIDPEARQMERTGGYSLEWARQVVVDRKFKRKPEAWGGSADLVRAVVRRVVTRHERRGPTQV